MQSARDALLVVGIVGGYYGLVLVRHHFGAVLSRVPVPLQRLGYAVLLVVAVIAAPGGAAAFRLLPVLAADQQSRRQRAMRCWRTHACWSLSRQISGASGSASPRDAGNTYDCTVSQADGCDGSQTPPAPHVRPLARGALAGATVLAG